MKNISYTFVSSVILCAIVYMSHDIYTKKREQAAADEWLNSLMYCKNTKTEKHFVYQKSTVSNETWGHAKPKVYDVVDIFGKTRTISSNSYLVCFKAIK